MTAAVLDIARSTDATVPVPSLPALGPASVSRPLTLLAWDAPNMDATLFSVCEGRRPERPALEAVTRWAHSLHEHGDEVEALLFAAIRRDRAAYVTPWITAARDAGFCVFARPLESGDIDDALQVAVTARLRERPGEGTLILATHDQALAGPLGDQALAKGWRVIHLGYRGAVSWVEKRQGWETQDIEDIAGAFTQPLPRLDLGKLPMEGTWLQPTRLRAQRVPS